MHSMPAKAAATWAAGKVVVMEGDSGEVDLGEVGCRHHGSRCS